MMNEEEIQRLIYLINEKFRDLVNERSMSIAGYIVGKNFPDGIITDDEITAQFNIIIPPEDIKLMLEKIKQSPLSNDHIR